jgi:hypothetical protein
MSIHNDRELKATRDKIRLLEKRVTALAKVAVGDAHIRELTVRALKSLRS